MPERTMGKYYITSGYYIVFFRAKSSWGYLPPTYLFKELKHHNNIKMKEPTKISDGFGEGRRKKRGLKGSEESEEEGRVSYFFSSRK